MPVPRQKSERISRPSIRERVRTYALKLLQENPAGLRYSELVRQIRQSNPSFNPNTVHTAIWNLDVVHPDRVQKPSKGLFCPVEPRIEEEVPAVATSRVREEVFYPLFANWLRDDLEDVTHAIALGGNAFKDRWGTPDVIGKAESRRSDVVKGPTSIVSAEIKVDTSGIVVGFGQACAYKLFSHKSYLVIPRETAQDELARVDSLCQIFGIGLVTFNSKCPGAPDFKLHLRPLKHEPDLSYTNRYVAHVEKELFS